MSVNTRNLIKPIKPAIGMKVRVGMRRALATIVEIDPEGEALLSGLKLRVRFVASQNETIVSVSMVTFFQDPPL